MKQKINKQEKSGMWNVVKENIMKAANETVGKCARLKNGRVSNAAVEELSEKQKKLRIQISDIDNAEKVEKLRSERNSILKEIQRINNEEKEKELDEKISEIEKMKDSAMMFKSVREIGRKRLENPFVHDEKGRHVTNPKEIHEIVKEHFQKHFYKPDEPEIQQFVGDPKPMNNPISTEEVTKGAKKLNNNRAADKSNLTGELVKYGPEKLHEEIRDVYNQSLNRAQDCSHFPPPPAEN